MLTCTRIIKSASRVNNKTELEIIQEYPLEFRQDDIFFQQPDIVSTGFSHEFGNEFRMSYMLRRYSKNETASPPYISSLNIMNKRLSEEKNLEYVKLLKTVESRKND